MDRLGQHGEERCYEELIKAGVPEDRIQRDNLFINLRPDFLVMPPGLSHIPLGVIEVKMTMVSCLEWLQKNEPQILSHNKNINVYAYSVEDKSFLSQNGNHLQKINIDYETLKKEWCSQQDYLFRLQLENFMLFETAEFQFGSRLNVIIGENGAGKTQLMKVLYAVSRMLLASSQDFDKDALTSEFKSVYGIRNLNELINCSKQKQQVKACVSITMTNGDKYTNIIQDGVCSSVNNPERNADRSTVYLPARELLSIYHGFSSLRQIYRDKWPYDQTYADCMTYLGLPTIGSQDVFAVDSIKEIEAQIQGRIYLDEQQDRFMMEMNGISYQIDLVAEGWRKLGELLQLIRVGAISPGTILFWDEPDANLNPQLIRLVAAVIVNLSCLGVQVFLTTHSLFLLREIDMLTKVKGTMKPGELRYFNLRKGGRVEQGDTPEGLDSILLLDESLAQSDRFMAMED